MLTYKDLVRRIKKKKKSEIDSGLIKRIKEAKKGSSTSNSIISEIKEKIKNELPKVIKRDVNPYRAHYIVSQIKNQYNQEVIDDKKWDINQINPLYQVTLNDDSIENPFIINSDLVDIIRSILMHMIQGKKKLKQYLIGCRKILIMEILKEYIVIIILKKCWTINKESVVKWLSCISLWQEVLIW